MYLHSTAAWCDEMRKNLTIWGNGSGFVVVSGVWFGLVVFGASFGLVG